ncbi:MAG TPA: hypothetical protein LFV92_04205 [Rickettsia endosymbiont of Ceroptres masudai]|nr:hypothetical protein [Rickettsia endosymbiont of Ceroptres masudai]
MLAWIPEPSLRGRLACVDQIYLCHPVFKPRDDISLFSGFPLLAKNDIKSIYRSTQQYLTSSRRLRGNPEK